MKRDPHLSVFKHCLILGNRSVAMTKPNSLRRGYRLNRRYHRRNATISHGLFFGPTSFASFYKGESVPPSFNWQPLIKIPYVGESFAHFTGD